MKNDFFPNSQEENTQTIANYLPEGDLFVGRNIENANFRKWLRGYAAEKTRIDNTVYALASESDITKTYNLIEKYESALGIPDDCFSIDVDIVQRRKQCVAKLALMNCTTSQDWIDLAAYFGYQIKIEYGSPHMVFPMKFPIIFGTLKEAKFTIIISFLNVPKPSNVFPLTFPITFGKKNFMVCLFEHIKPANVRIIYKYLG